MFLRRWVIALTVIALAQPAAAQKVSDKKVVKQLKKDVGYLASDELGGRRTGSEGEQLAADYIIAFYEANGIPAYKGQYRYPFTFTAGRSAGKNTIIEVDGKPVQKKEEGFPLSFSGNGKVQGEVLPDVMEQGKIWMISMFEDEDEANDAHFNWEKSAYERAENAVKSGATGVVFYDKFDAKYPAVFNKRTEYQPLSVPVVYLTYKAYRLYINPNQGDNIPSVAVEINTDLKDKKLTGTNIAAYLDNGAKYTVVLGAHYDHLGHGEDGNSLHAAKDGAIHNGADDNASGTAALMHLADWIKDNGLNRYNYLFLHFSAEELGLIGSKKVVEELKLDSSNVAYMMNMDMVGRLNDSTHALTVGGVGTSPAWAKAVNFKDPRFKIVVDSSGVGPSDHTSFYYQGVPVLFFFTGTHSDYHKPSDDADKVNYKGQVQIMKYIYATVENMEKQPKPAFTKTKQSTVGRVRMKVTMGVMPDYSFNDGGLRIDGVTEGRPAQKAGLKGGDIITKIGKYEVRGIQTYMEVLGNLDEGQKTTVTILRDGKEMTLPLEFGKK